MAARSLIFIEEPLHENATQIAKGETRARERVRDAWSKDQGWVGPMKSYR